MKRFSRQYILAAAICAIIIFMISSTAAAGVIYVKWDSPGPTFDGKSWDTAYQKVQDGINATSSGDEVWVAKGTYIENITMKDGVALYGGFTGTETGLGQRDWQANETEIGIVTQAASSTVGMRIDGFAMDNQKPAIRLTSGGIVTVANCNFTECSASIYGMFSVCTTIVQDCSILGGNGIDAGTGSVRVDG